MEQVYLHFSVENVITVLLIGAAGFALWTIVGQGVLKATGQ